MSDLIELHPCTPGPQGTAQPFTDLPSDSPVFGGPIPAESTMSRILGVAPAPSPLGAKKSGDEDTDVDDAADGDEDEADDEDEVEDEDEDDELDDEDEDDDEDDDDDEEEDEFFEDDEFDDDDDEDEFEEED